MNELDRYANAAFYESNRAERLLVQRDALEEALEEAELEIAAWRALCFELIRAQRCSP